MFITNLLTELEAVRASCQDVLQQLGQRCLEVVCSSLLTDAAQAAPWLPVLAADFLQNLSQSECQRLLELACLCCVMAAGIISTLILWVGLIWERIDVYCRPRGRNRRHNAWLGNSDSNLLSLPPDILRDILKRVGKGATRFICAAARDAYGTPGTSICIPQLPEDKEATNVLLRWPDPAGVTQIRLYMLLNQSVGQALEARFTNLQELALLAYGERQIFAHLPGSIVRLTTLVYGGRDQFTGLSRLTRLQALSLDCGFDPVLNQIHPLSALTTLTSLDLHGHSNSTHLYTASQLSFWSVLAALSKLARLSLNVPINYHTKMPAAAAPLEALTHLELWCVTRMVRVLAPVHQVLHPSLLPALVSLKLTDMEHLTDTSFPSNLRTLLAEPVHSLPQLRHLEVDAMTSTSTSSTLAPFQTPSLTSFVVTNSAGYAPAL